MQIPYYPAQPLLEDVLLIVASLLEGPTCLRISPHILGTKAPSQGTGLTQEENQAFPGML